MKSEKINGIVAIVDAYSSGNLLAPVLDSRNFDCLHVQSAPKILPISLSSFRSQDFKFHLTHEGSFAQTLNRVRELKPVAVLAGTETGVALADALSEGLGLKTNGTKLSTCRRNKYDMGERIRAQSLRAVYQLKTNSIANVIEWKQLHQISWPIVIKPLNSAASDGVFLCQNESELRRSFELECGEINKLGSRNDELLVQEFLEGPEFIVDTVSSNGRHYVTDILESNKMSVPQGNGSSFLYDYQAFISPEAPEVAVLQNYIFRVLDALGIQFGPAHAEVILTASGPVLVEVGARLAGTYIPLIVNACTGQSPVELTIDSYCDEANFLKVAKNSYRLNKHGRLIYLRAKESGRLRSISALDEIRKMSSFYDIKMAVSVGDLVTKTNALYSVPGVLELVHKDESRLKNDHAIFNSLQSRGLFEIEPLLTGTGSN